MDEILKSLIENLPESPTVLDDSTRKKIYKYIPVPTDYKILWADITSFGGYPSGIIITDKALIVKATKNELKHNKEQIKKENKRGKEKLKIPNVIYQIILWEYYSPEDYEITTINDGKKERYIFKSGSIELTQFGDKAFYNLVKAYKKKTIEARESAESTFSAVNSINIEGVMFNAAYGADQTKTGHGIYAEEAGAILDKLSGENSTVVGRDNAKNGPDKIVNASPIQCKYCKQASNSVNACFKTNPTTGVKEFRYYDLNGNAMKVEVPADQYVQAVEYMKAKISNGQVPGVSDPKAAYDIIRKGKLTYNQALNLAKAGTVESITYDAATGAINCLSVFGISSIVTFAQVYWATKDYKKAAKSAVFTGIQVYGMAFAGGVIASQISRTGFVTMLNPLTSEISKAISPKMAQEIVNAFRALAGKKAIYGAAAQKSFAKFLGSTAITQSIMFFVFSVPDTYKLISGKMSGAQYFKNMTALGASFLGAIGGTAIAGSAIGKVAGGAINKKAGAAIGMVAGTLCGATCGAAAKGINNLLHEDDAIITARMFNAILLNQFIEYMVTEKEQDKIISLLNEDEKPLQELQRELLKSKSQGKDIIRYLEPKIKKIIGERGLVSAEDEERMEESISVLVEEGGLAYGV